MNRRNAAPTFSGRCGRLPRATAVTLLMALAVVASTCRMTKDSESGGNGDFYHPHYSFLPIVEASERMVSELKAFKLFEKPEPFRGVPDVSLYNDYDLDSIRVTHSQSVEKTDADRVYESVLVGDCHIQPREDNDVDTILLGHVIRVPGADNTSSIIREFKTDDPVVRVLPLNWLDRTIDSAMRRESLGRFYFRRIFRKSKCNTEVLVNDIIAAARLPDLVGELPDLVGEAAGEIGAGLISSMESIIRYTVRYKTKIKPMRMWMCRRLRNLVVRRWIFFFCPERGGLFHDYIGQIQACAPHRQSVCSTITTAVMNLALKPLENDPFHLENATSS